MPQRDEPPHLARSRSRSPRRDRGGYDREREREREREPRAVGSRSPRKDWSERRGDRGERERDRRDRDRGDRYGSGPRSASGSAPPAKRDDGYGPKEREAEREADRKRYDESGELVRAKSPPKPDFSNSGLLAKESNSIKGVALKYHEPPEARKPNKNWRLYVFKGDEQVDLIHIYRQSCYLVGRDQVVTDIPIQHPSCSKQHAVIQFRQITSRNEYGDSKTEIKPFVIDLDSTNGTYVNGKEVPKSRYYELLPSDVLKFGTSNREYVLLHEDAK